MPEHLILATRGSKLALAQSEWVRDQLCRAHPGLQVELQIIKTTGDRNVETALPQMQGKGLFTREIEEALLAKRAHLAVHSLKDLPTELPEGIALAAMPVREDPRDVLVCREASGLQTLPLGARVGTCSPRRSAQLAYHRADLQFHAIRGNVDTRLRKLTEEGLDAIVLAGAGLTRLGLADRITEWLPVEISVPAAGQGIIGVEARADDATTQALLEPLNAPESCCAALAERAALAALGGGCQRPIGVLAQITGGTCHLTGAVLDSAGTRCARAQLSGPAADPEALGQALAEALLRQGARELLG